MKIKQTVRFFVALYVLVQWCVQPLTTYAAEPSALPQGAVVISEIFANPTISPEKGSSLQHEFIELHNTLGVEVNLAGFSLVRDDNLADQQTNGEMSIGNISLAPYEYRIINPSFNLINSSSTIILTYPSPSEAIDGRSYESGAASEGYSWQQLDFEGHWGNAAPTPNAPPALTPIEPPLLPTPQPEEPTPEPPVDPPLEPEEPPEEPNPEPSACDIEEVHISEILANPAGSDSAGGEFVELYNDNEQPVSLIGCELATNKPTSYEFQEADSIAGKSYKAFTFQNGLLNGGGTVTFATASYEEVEGGLGGFLPCPPGKFRNPETNRCKSIASDSPGLTPCAPGKIRNPITNRCRNASDTTSALVPCKPGQYRHPETNRCRSLTTASTTLVPCKSGQERNPSTNRCRKIGGETNALKPCAPGYERNPETNRCRKTSTLGASLENSKDTPPANNAQNLALVIIAAMFLGFFLLYEYRLSIRDRLAAIRIPGLSKQTNNKD